MIRVAGGTLGRGNNDTADLLFFNSTEKPSLLGMIYNVDPGGFGSRRLVVNLSVEDFADTLRVLSLGREAALAYDFDSLGGPSRRLTAVTLASGPELDMAVPH
jgi:hypothetical protein